MSDIIQTHSSPKTLFVMVCRLTASPIIDWNHWVRGSIDSHFFKWGSKNTFWPPLLTCTKHVYCRVWVTINISCTIDAIHCVHYAHKIDTNMSYNPCIERHSRTVILCPQNTENIHQINNVRKPSRALHFHQDRTDKMDLNDLCQTFVSSRPKERRESLFGK